VSSTAPDAEVIAAIRSSDGLGLFLRRRRPRVQDVSLVMQREARVVLSMIRRGGSDALVILSEAKDLNLAAPCAWPGDPY
jgi:hypothetical protein